MPDPFRTRLLRALRNGPWVPLATLVAVLVALACVHAVLDDDAPIVVHVDADRAAQVGPGPADTPGPLRPEEPAR